MTGYVLHTRRIFFLIGVGMGGATGPWPPHFLAKIILKISPLFLNTILTRKTIHQDEESTNLR